MARRCSHCCNNGHNSRTCPTRCSGVGVDGGGGVKLFGVRLTESPMMKKSASMGNLLHYHSSSSAAASPNSASPTSEFLHGSVSLVDGYLSDDPAHATRRAERKKGIPWTEEEHRLFLVGLQKLGKGDWRGIARNFVMSRTPTQVASHAQKYFIRMSNASRRRRRSSLFDIVPELVPEPPPLEEEEDPTADCEAAEGGDTNSFPSLSLALNTEPMDATSEGVNAEDEEKNVQTNQLTTMVPAFLPAYIPITIPIWFSNSVSDEVYRGAVATHEVLKPTPVVCGEPVNLDEVVKMSGLSLEELTNGGFDPLQPALKLLGLSPRTSAFHVNTVSSALT